VGWGSAVVGAGAWVVGTSAGDVVVGGLLGVMLGALVGKVVLDGVGVSDERGGTVVLVVARGRTTGLVGLSTPVAGLAGTGSAAAGRTIR
jgi:hypothetical protein